MIFQQWEKKNLEEMVQRNSDRKTKGMRRKNKREEGITLANAPGSCQEEVSKKTADQVGAWSKVQVCGVDPPWTSRNTLQNLS
jgi:6-phosphogluconolactonase/glucosamine-6-phosphate isomerase/deaminase